MGRWADAKFPDGSRIFGFDRAAAEQDGQPFGSTGLEGS